MASNTQNLERSLEALTMAIVTLDDAADDFKEKQAELFQAILRCRQIVDSAKLKLTQVVVNFEADSVLLEEQGENKDG